MVDIRQVSNVWNWQINVRENRRGNQEWTIQRNWQINVRENRRGNQEWTIQRNWQINVRENRRGNQEWTIQRNLRVTRRVSCKKQELLTLDSYRFLVGSVLLIFFVFCFVYISTVYCVPNVVSFSRFFILDEKLRKKTIFVKEQPSWMGIWI
jgi:hypothetical protein